MDKEKRSVNTLTSWKELRHKILILNSAKTSRRWFHKISGCRFKVWGWHLWFWQWIRKFSNTFWKLIQRWSSISRTSREGMMTSWTESCCAASNNGTLGCWCLSNKLRLPSHSKIWSPNSSSLRSSSPFRSTTSTCKPRRAVRLCSTCQKSGLTSHGHRKHHNFTCSWSKLASTSASGQDERI